MKLNKSKGIALIMCLVLMAVFFAMATYVTGKQKQQLELFMGLQQKVELGYQAESMLQQLNFSIATNSPFIMYGQEYKLNSYGTPIVLEDGSEMTITSGYGAISMVPFDDEAFTKLVEKVTDDSGLGRPLANRILDWQDPDNFARINSKEGGFGSTDDYQPRNYLMQSLSELKLVDGMTEELFRQLEPHLIYYKISPLEERAASDSLRQLLDLPKLERQDKGYNIQVNGLRIGRKQPVVFDIKIKGEHASLQQKYFIHYWPTLNDLWSYSEFGE